MSWTRTFGRPTATRARWERVASADTLVYIDLPLITHFLWVTKRLLKGPFVRPEGWPERIPMLSSTINSYTLQFHLMAIMTGRKWVILVAALGALLRPPETASQEACSLLRDEALVLKVQSKLQFSPLLTKVGSVVVASKDCVVTLAGTVPEADNIVEAERIAASVQGVRRVRNTLRVASQ
jgi:BON domain